MIKSDKGETEIKGTSFDVMFDIDCIMRGILLQHPEYVVSWIANNEHLIDEAAHRCRKLDTEAADFVFTTIARIREGFENED